MSEDAWNLLRDLMTAVDMHRLTTTDPDEHDLALYSTVARIRRRLA